MNIYEKVMELCKLNGVEKTTLEESCGFSQNSINKWKESVPSVDRIIKVADYFGVSIDYLLGHDVQEKNQSFQTEKVDIKPAYSRTRKETVDMLMYRYQNVVNTESFWLMVELVSHIKSADSLHFFALLFNAMLDKGYPVADYWTEAEKYFIKGETEPEIWNIGIETTTTEERQITIKNVADAAVGMFGENYKNLLLDKSFRDTAKLFNAYDEEFRAIIIEVLIKWLDTNIRTKYKQYPLPKEILGDY